MRANSHSSNANTDGSGRPSDVSAPNATPDVTPGSERTALLYVLTPLGGGQNAECRLDWHQRHVDKGGAVQPRGGRIPELLALHDSSGIALDDFDVAIMRQLRRLDPRELESQWENHVAIHVITRAAKAGRLHLAASPNIIGPALRWRGDMAWNCERHVLCTADGARSWIRLIAERQPHIDCIEPAVARFAQLVVVKDVVLDCGRKGELEGPRATEKGTRSTCWLGTITYATREVLAGAETHSRDALPLLMDELRHQNDRYPRAHGPRPVLNLDTRLGISFFDAKPFAVLRLDGAAHRSTVDVLPLARYVHPDHATIVVDRDPRTHRIVDNPSSPELTVPRGDRQFESGFHSLARDMLYKARGAGQSQWRIPRVQLPTLLGAAAKAQFLVEMQKQMARIGGAWSLSVRSGIDWFDLNGALETPQGAIPLRELVDAARREPDAIEILPLSDGTSVLVPAKMRAVLRRLARIISTREPRVASATGSTSGNDPLQFARSEALLLHTLLQQADRSQEDAAFRDLRQRLESFHTPRALAPPASFTGTLRDYQQLGLGWFERLRELHMGGCLADEMGLGKTVQVLALLASQHEARPRPASSDRPSAVPTGPSLLVVPRSIVRN